MNKEKETLFTKLEELGLPSVQAKLASSTWKNSEEEYVLEWVLTKKDKIQDSKEKIKIDLTNKSIQVSRSAKNASWWSVVISILSLIIACLALYFSLK
ncbi:MAG: hypothetical protein KKD24_00165 [Proteobacteria bacterium]|nr:hypothetical protein [Pseudomonadota bacterium]